MANTLAVTPDEIVFATFTIAGHTIPLNATIVYTWIVMAVLLVVSWLATRSLTATERDAKATNVPLWRHVMEATILYASDEIEAIVKERSPVLLSIIGTLFLFIATSNFLSVIPHYMPPTGSLSTTAALTAVVFFTVPLYGISRVGLFAYLKTYLEPTPYMLPLNIFQEASRTMALMVRLFGNHMSGTIMATIVLAIAPLLVPVLMQLLGLLTGFIHAYIFAVLATFYIGAAIQSQRDEKLNAEYKASQ